MINKENTIIKGEEKTEDLSHFAKKLIKILHIIRLYTTFVHETMKDSRIRQSDSNDNRTRQHPVDLLAGHFF
ncbi:MAG: hypothetical protein IJK42_06675 [Prevotella sp.]|nr:hypothetical protein [Prevotella sp.]